MVLKARMFPGLPERNPGLELANAFSVTEQDFPHSLYRMVVLTSYSRRERDCGSKPAVIDDEEE